MATSNGFLSAIAHNNRIALLCASVVLAGGITIGSVSLAKGMVAMKRADREVTVRGVAQRNVTANRASWSVNYSEAAYDLSEALSTVDRDSATIRKYLAKQGFNGAMTKPSSANISVTDEYRDGKYTGRKVYTVRRTISFTTSKVAQVQAVQANKDELAQGGLVVDDVNVSYEYTELDKVKPEMIAEATKDARRAAEKFASDSGSSVGGIKSATQGYFSVSSREAPSGDEEYGSSGQTASSPDQRVRVVTTIDYYLD
ncbi:MAG: SIMPL domain-containing protein [Tsuneonella suprasediminis]|uniref:SIMPL domain-containing protein n=1 Tax=Tsuneonella suprasediminis TaxID=2306996 RepID=A0A419QZ31_9SPHN|nr:SIMPL domain-containing protein [Tsuneonella suprasediminis]RJX66068.1 SIMPL domain-containing protein [Tsuneonella suprasediminis]UBS32712.1 SIMPL domain-containing protein [Altererythrobacter sp. N1]